MQTKFVLILVTLLLHTLVACTNLKTDNEQETAEITLSDEPVNVGETAEAAFNYTSDFQETVKKISPIVDSITFEKEKTATQKPAVSPKTTPETVTKVIQAKEKQAVDSDSAPIKEQKVEAIPQETPTVDHAPEPMEAPTSVSHEIWDQLLQKYVSKTGKVNYNGLKGEMSQLDSYIKLLNSTYPNEKWSRNEQLAYWINVYNANTVKLILVNYPIKSITDLGKPWDKKFINVGKISYSLNQIENEIIRPVFQEPRIHFAVNCAAKSCPPLLNEAFTAEKLNNQLDKQTRAFINSSANKIAERNVEVSKIFDWYGEDFGELIAYLNKYATTPINESAKISFKEYDWALNE
jgi:hypothetical protein